MSKAPKTTGKEWLHHSLMAFNGSGYADMSSPDDYLESYMAYKSMRNNKRNKEAVSLARQYGSELLPDIEKLLAKTYGASRKPAQKYLDKLQAIRDHSQGTLL